MRLRQSLPLLVVVLVALLSASASAANAAPGFHLRKVRGPLSEPVWVGSPRGDSRLFAVERSGRIIVWANGRKRVFMDIRDRVNADGGEQGLLSIAFHNDFARNHRFWVYYTTGNGDGRVVEYKARSNRGLRASARRVLNVPLGEGADNHNGGHLVYSGGNLWISVGDGGGGGDPNNYGQNRSDLRGKLLRVHVDGARPYTIPTGNPYTVASGFRREIFAIGLRNPWRFSIDRETSDVYIGDVGQGAIEELDRLPGGRGAGANFGWRRFEGTSVYDSGTALASGTTHTPPVVQYSHNGGGCSVTGGVVYRGSVSALRGYYLYADYCTQWVAGFKRSGARKFTRNVGVPGIVHIGEGPRREVYVASISNGNIYRVVR